MPREAYVYRIILDYLKKSNDSVTTTELVDKTSIPYSTIARVMRKLTLEKRVKRVHGYANSYAYRFITYDLPEKGPNLSLPVDPNTTTLAPLDISSDKLFQQFAIWAEDGWSPAVVNSTKDVMRVVSKLYSWATIASEGRPVEDSQLKMLYDSLDRDKRAAESYLRFITGLLAISELWDSKRFAAWLLNTDSVTSSEDSVSNLASAVETQSKYLNT